MKLKRQNAPRTVDEENDGGDKPNHTSAGKHYCGNIAHVAFD